MRYLLLLFLPLTAMAQFTIEQPFFSAPASAPSVYSPSNETLIRYWWVASDLTTNTSVTSWTDRITGAQYTNTAAAGPTNSATGIGFDGSKRLLTKTFWASTVNTTGTVYVICTPQSGGGLLGSNPSQDYTAGYGLWLDGTPQFYYWGSAGNGAVGSFTPGTSVDILMLGNDSTTCNFYTNGIVSKNTVFAMPGYISTIGRGSSSSYFNGKVKELMAFSGVVNSTTISNLHRYATNTYGFSP